MGILLDILIPTYNRPKIVSRSIERCLKLNDNRYRIICNSNGYENSLEKYRNHSTQVVYSCFDSNKGAADNFLFLLKKTSAQYCMLLSDEDYIDDKGLKKLLDFLEYDLSLGVISCSIYDNDKKNFFYRPANFLVNNRLDISDVMSIFFLPHYMSGYIYNVGKLQELDLDILLKSSVSNAYPHMEITREILNKNYLMVYSDKAVIKGEDANIGGDAFSHRDYIEGEKDESECADLNPNLYGPYALTRQFFFFEQGILSSRKYLTTIAFNIVNIRRLFHMYISIINSDKLVVVDKEEIEKEVINGISDAKKYGEFSNSYFSKLFIVLLKVDKNIIKVMSYSIRITIPYIALLYVKFLRSRKNDNKL